MTEDNTPKYKSKRLKKVDFVNDGLPDEFSYCRKCRRVRKNYLFHKAVDTFIDSNGKFSVCKDCCNDIYTVFLRETGSTERAILKCCTSFNVVFNQDAITAAQKQVASKDGNEEKSLWGLYLAKLSVIYRDNVTDKAEELNLTFKPNININIQDNEIISDEYADLVQFWGTDKKSDIIFLEREYGNFKETHKADTYAEITLLKNVCYKLLDMENDRKAGRSTDASLKQLLDLMKNLAISPSMVNAAASGKSLDTFGQWIKDIETMRPAEWVEDKSIWANIDDLEKYTEENIISPLRSFVTGNKEFTIDETESVDADEEE